LAAEQGYVDAQFRLGVMYAKGKVIIQDYMEAVKWFRVLAKQGFAEAQKKLGMMYRDGQGVSQDSIRAHMWFNLAENQGVSSAKKKRIKIAETMTPLQIAVAKKMARYCEKKDYKKCE
jgi:TPR repeat protein